MSLTYAGVPTAAQAPGGVPGPAGVPKALVVTDGDPVNAASFAQALKWPADWIAWLTAPFAIVSAWIQSIVTWRNARLQTRALVSHAGFIEGKILGWRETWQDLNTVNAKTAVGNGPWFGKWWYSISGDAAGGAIYADAANIGPPTFGGGPTGTDADVRTRSLWLATNPTGTIGSAQEVESPGQIILDADTSVTMQWDAKIHTVSGNSDDAMGFVTTSLLGATGTTLSNAPFGAWFERGPGDTTWLCFWQGAAGSGVASINSGVAPAGRQRFRIEVYGSNSSDDTAHRVLFYINGALITDQIVDFTNAAPGAGVATATPFFRHFATAELTWLNVQVTDFNANTWAGDVAY